MERRFLVAGYGDGTIRWHRAKDGQELLALFPHADRKRWIAWTPEGVYATSGPDAEDLMGYHLNRGKDQAGEFVAARQLRDRFYQPGLISRRLDPDGDALVAEAVKELGDVRQLLAGAAARTPLGEVLSGTTVTGEVAARAAAGLFGMIEVRTPSVEVLSGTTVTGEEEVTIEVRVKDRGGGIGGLVFYVDGQPQAGRRAGIVADGTESRIFALPPGGHTIEMAASNRSGVEGPRGVVTATLTGPAQDAALHILAVGVERYQAPGLGLRHSVADA